MNALAYNPADVLASIASAGLLAVVKSMSDGQWATTAQLCAATGVSEGEIATVLHNLEMGGCLEQLGDHYRMDCDGVRKTLSHAATTFTQELRAA